MPKRKNESILEDTDITVISLDDDEPEKRQKTEEKAPGNAAMAPSAPVPAQIPLVLTEDQKKLVELLSSRNTNPKMLESCFTSENKASLLNDPLDIEGNTAIIIAAKWGKNAFIEKLLAMDADVNAVNKFGSNALHLAAINDRDSTIKLLLPKMRDKNAIINAPDKRTALHFAAWYGYLKSVKVLLDEKVDATIVDGYGKSALDLATEANALGDQRGKEKVAIALKSYLDNGTFKLPTPRRPAEATLMSPPARTRNNKSPTSQLYTSSKTASAEKSPELSPAKPAVEPAALPEKLEAIAQELTLLVKRGKQAEVTAKLATLSPEDQLTVINSNANRYPLLNVAALNDDTTMMALLVEKKADINATATERQDSPLHSACAWRFASATNYILQQPGVKVAVKNGNGSTPLHLSVKSRTPELMDLLVNKDPSILEMKTKKDQTALHLAAERGFTPEMEALITLKADVNAVDGEGLTPLLTAVHHGHGGTPVELLLKYNTSKENKEKAMKAAFDCEHDIILKQITTYDKRNAANKPK